MANIYDNRKIHPDMESVEVYLSESLSNIFDWDNWDMIEKVEKQVNKLPSPIPKISILSSISSLEPNSVTADRIALVKKLSEIANDVKKAQIFVAYEPGATYRLGNTVGKVWNQTSKATGTLILLNDQRIQQVSGGDLTYLVNLVLHEVMHVYGLDHAQGLPFNKVRNTPVMNAGKFGKLGLSQDDIAGLRERYEVPPRKRVCLTVNAASGRIGLVNKEKNARSQGKKITKGKAIFPQLHKGRYHVYHNDVKVKTITVNKDRSISL